MVGCTNKQDTKQNSDVNNEIIYDENNGLPADMSIDEKIDENLYVEAEFHMPEELFIYSSELKKFDYNKVQSILWPDASANHVTTNEFGERQYGDASFRGENGSLIYRASDDINYIDTLCFYVKEKSIISKKDLEFATIEKVETEAEEFISKFDIGCELGKPDIVALNSDDLAEVQEKIMKDDEYKNILSAKNLGNSSFGSDTEIYYFEYSFVINHIPVFGHDDPMVRQSGDTHMH